MRIAIIGGGINGYSCAVKFLEHFKESKNESIEVTVITDEISPNTTGDGSAGLWGPFLLGSTSKEKIYKWSKSMHTFLENIWLSEDAGEAGVCLIPVIRLTTSVEPLEDFWKDIVFGASPLTQAQLDEYGSLKGKKFTNGIQFVTYTSEPIKLLPYLMKRFQLYGGKTIKKKIHNLIEFIDNSEYDVIINCTGLGSRNLIGDNKVLPVRGQVSRVKANWLYYVLLDESDDGNYVIPNSESVVLGGTHQENDYNTEVSVSDKNFIIKGCNELIPSLQNAVHLFDWVGLRPGRDHLRLETEKIGKNFVIHNYGHGGAGVTMAWGCAEEALELLQDIIKEKGKSIKSKL